MGNGCWIYRRRPIPNHTGKPKGEILTLKIVIDTNVVISALFFGGNPQDLLQLVIGKTLDAYASPSIIEEYNEVMDRIAKKYPRKKEIFPYNAFCQVSNLYILLRKSQYAGIQMTINSSNAP